MLKHLEFVTVLAYFYSPVSKFRSDISNRLETLAQWFLGIEVICYDFLRIIFGLLPKYTEFCPVL